MEQREIRFEKKRDPGTVIADSFLFLRYEFKPLAKLVLLYVIPFLILYGFGSVVFQKKIASFNISNPEQIMQNAAPFYLNFLFYLLFGIFIQLLYAGAFYTYMEAYLKKGKGNFTINDISHQLFSNSLLSLGTGMVASIIVFFGIMLCIIPGIYFANSLSVALFIVIFEKKGIGNALSRSFQLVSIRWWDTFLINLTGLILIFIINLILSVPLLVSGFSHGLFSQKTEIPVAYPEWYWIYYGIDTLITNLFYILIYIFYAFHYFNLNEYLRNRENPSEGTPLS